MLTLTILCHFSDRTLGVNTPPLITFFVNPSTPSNFFVSLLPKLESRRFLFTYEILTQSCTFYIVADHF